MKRLKKLINLLTSSGDELLVHIIHKTELQFLRYSEFLIVSLTSFNWIKQNTYFVPVSITAED